MMSIFSMALLVAVGLIVYIANLPVAGREEERICDHGRIFCVAIFMLGCAMRLFALGTLPEGLSAEEALVGVQARALWQTGGFYPNGVLTTVLPQWTGNTTGPLLAVLAAPLAGVFGISPLTLRLPLVMLSIAAIPAAYVLGCTLSGKSAGRFMLFIYALCPYFVLGARMTCGANAALFMLPIAAALLVAGINRPALLYAGMAAMALCAYTQTMMLVIAPAMVLGAAAVVLASRKSRIHALLSALLGFALSMPALLTAYVNICETEGFMLFGLVEIPNRDLLGNTVFSSLSLAMSVFEWFSILLYKLWCTIVGGLFQAIWLENINSALFMPEGMLALTVVSIPLMILGTGTLALRSIEGNRSRKQVADPHLLVVVMFVIALSSVIIFGNTGSYSIGGAPDVFDHANLFLFAALLMTAGWRQMQRRSVMCTRLLAGILVVCVAWLGVHLFGGSYQMGATTYFNGFSVACAYAKEIQNKTGASICVTTTVYPHVAADEAAQIMYLCATNADLREEQNFATIYAPGLDQVDETKIYVVRDMDIYGWDWGNMHYEPFENYVVLCPDMES